jgi:hypothetical protein
MQKPFYGVTAECRNEQCEMTIFTEERTDEPGPLSVLACPRCGQHAAVFEVEQVTPQKEIKRCANA